MEKKKKLEQRSYLYLRQYFNFLITLCQPFSNLNFPCCKYLAVPHINTKNRYQITVWPKKNCDWLEKHIAHPSVIAKTCGYAFQALDSAFGFH